jgi:YD repeat-containing protein
MLDPLGNVTTHSTGTDFSLTGANPPGAGVYTITRNTNLQEVSRELPSGAMFTRLYDSAGNPTGNIDAYGNITTLQYDAYNNPTTLQYADGSMVLQIPAENAQRFCFKMRSDSAGKRAPVPVENAPAFQYATRTPLT